MPTDTGASHLCRASLLAWRGKPNYPPNPATSKENLDEGEMRPLVSVGSAGKGRAGTPLPAAARTECAPCQPRRRLCEKWFLDNSCGCEALDGDGSPGGS